MSAFGIVKRAQFLHALSPEEQEQVERLERRTRLSGAAEGRPGQVWGRPHGLDAQRLSEPFSP
jgi:hypothetical protein